MAFAELKARQSVMWGNGPYERITNTIRDIHALVVERLVGELRLEGQHEPLRGLAGRVRDDVELDRLAAGVLGAHSPQATAEVETVVSLSVV